MPKHKYSFYILILLLIVNVSVQAQGVLNFKFKPRGTELIEQKNENKGEGMAVTQYKYRSSPKDEIVKFYRLMFKNWGYKELKNAWWVKNKDSIQLRYFFTKNDNTLIILSFLSVVDEGMYTYYIVVQRFDLKKGLEKAHDEDEPLKD